MADDNVHNATVDILRKIQADIAAFRHVVTERFDKSDAAVAELQIAVAAIRTGQAAATEHLGKIEETQQVHGAHLNTIDARLATIEKHTGYASLIAARRSMPGDETVKTSKTEG